MRLIALTCFAAVALACSPAAAGCYGYKFVIGKQFVPGPGQDPEKAFEARYDLRGGTYEVFEDGKKREGSIENYCDTATVVLYELKKPDGSTPSEGQNPQGQPRSGTLTVASPTEDDGICWLKVSVADVNGWCFRRRSGPVRMQGQIY
jgi:hypothetical protein